MQQKKPFDIIKHKLVSEKANMLASLKDAESNKCLKKFKNSKYVFVVDKKANKKQIKDAIEEIYSKKNVKVIDVNTITTKAKPKVFRGKLGATKPFKKAIVTLREGDNLDENE